MGRLWARWSYIRLPAGHIGQPVLQQAFCYSLLLMSSHPFHMMLILYIYFLLTIYFHPRSWNYGHSCLSVFWFCFIKPFIRIKTPTPQPWVIFVSFTVAILAGETIGFFQTPSVANVTPGLCIIYQYRYTWVTKCPHFSHHPTIRYMVYNGYYKVMSNIPKMGQLPTPDIDRYGRCAMCLSTFCCSCAGNWEN